MTSNSLNFFANILVIQLIRMMSASRVDHAVVIDAHMTLVIDCSFRNVTVSLRWEENEIFDKVKLDLSSNNLTTIPSLIGNWRYRKVEMLNLSHNAITSIDQNILASSVKVSL